MVRGNSKRTPSRDVRSMPTSPLRVVSLDDTPEPVAQLDLTLTVTRAGVYRCRAWRADAYRALPEPRPAAIAVPGGYLEVEWVNPLPCGESAQL
jgi:hypothetical protein